MYRELYETTDITSPVDTGRKLNVHKTFRRRPERLLNILMCVQFTSCVFGVQCWAFFKENHGNTKRINFQFHYCKFSKQRNFILFITTSALVEGGEGEVSPALSWKSEESALMLGKKALILIIYRLNSLKFFMEEKPEMFPYSAFHFLVFGECQSVLIPRKLLCPDKFLVTHLYLMTYLRIAQEKNRFIDSLVEHFTKIMKMLNVPIFSFIILNLVKKGILDPSCYYSFWHICERRNWKLP